MAEYTTISALPTVPGMIPASPEQMAPVVQQISSTLKQALGSIQNTQTERQFRNIEQNLDKTLESFLVKLTKNLPEEQAKATRESVKTIIAESEKSGGATEVINQLKLLVKDDEKSLKELEKINDNIQALTAAQLAKLKLGEEAREKRDSVPDAREIFRQSIQNFVGPALPEFFKASKTIQEAQAEAPFRKIEKNFDDILNSFISNVTKTLPEEQAKATKEAVMTALAKAEELGGAEEVIQQLKRMAVDDEETFKQLEELNENIKALGEDDSIKELKLLEEEREKEEKGPTVFKTVVDKISGVFDGLLRFIKVFLVGVLLALAIEFLPAIKKVISGILDVIQFFLVPLLKGLFNIFKGVLKLFEFIFGEENGLPAMLAAFILAFAAFKFFSTSSAVKLGVAAKSLTASAASLTLAARALMTAAVTSRRGAPIVAPVGTPGGGTPGGGTPGGGKKPTGRLGRIVASLDRNAFRFSIGALITSIVAPMASDSLRERGNEKSADVVDAVGTVADVALTAGFLYQVGRFLMPAKAAAATAATTATAATAGAGGAAAAATKSGLLARAGMLLLSPLALKGLLVGAASYAGYKIGTALYNNFETVRNVSQTVVGGVHRLVTGDEAPMYDSSGRLTPEAEAAEEEVQARSRELMRQGREVQARRLAEEQDITPITPTPTTPRSSDVAPANVGKMDGRATNVVNQTTAASSVVNNNNNISSNMGSALHADALAATA